jgi:hypothetical protein
MDLGFCEALGREGKEPAARSESLADLRKAVLLWQKRAEDAEAELKAAREQLLLTPGNDSSHAEDDGVDPAEEWQTEKEMWREEVIRLTREIDTRESDSLRLNEVLAQTNNRLEELESLNFELSEENARLRNMLRSSAPSSAPFIRGQGSPVHVKNLPPRPDDMPHFGEDSHDFVIEKWIERDGINVTSH